MLDYLAESIAISFVVGTMLGAFITMQFSMAKFRSDEQRTKHRE